MKRRPPLNQITLGFCVFLLAACNAKPVATPETSTVPVRTQIPETVTPTIIPSPQPSPTTPPLPTPTEIINASIDDRLDLKVLGQAWGALTDMEFTDELGYLAIGPRLVVVQVAEDGTLQEVWRSELLPGVARDLALDGERLYWLSGDVGILVFDLGDPRQPQQVGVKQVYGNTRLIHAAGQDLFSVAWDCPGTSCQGRLLHLDQTDLNSLGDLGSIEVPAPVVDLWIAGETVFVVHAAGLSAFDASRVGELSLLDELQTGYSSSVAPAGDYAYLFAERLLTIDISDPANLRQVNLEVPEAPGFYMTGTVADNGRLYGFESFGEFGFCNSFPYILDVSNPVEPVLLNDPGQDLSFHCVGQVALHKERLVIADWDGLSVLDVSGEIKRLGFIPYELSVPAIMVQDGIAYWGNASMGASLHVADLRNPTVPTMHGPFPPQWSLHLATLPGILVAPVWNDGLRLLDISDPFLPRELAGLSVEQLSGATYRAVVDPARQHIVYLTQAEAGIQAVDVSLASQPRLLGHFGETCPAGSTIALAAAASHTQKLYAILNPCTDETNARTLAVIDTQDPENLVLMGMVTLPGSPENFAIAALDSLVLVTAYPWEGSTASGELVVFDASQPGQPVILARLIIPGNLQEILVVDHIAYVAAGEAGIFAVDLSQPQAPILVDHMDTPGNATGLASEGDLLYVADQEGGILILQGVRQSR